MQTTTLRVLQIRGGISKLQGIFGPKRRAAASHSTNLGAANQHRHRSTPRVVTAWRTNCIVFVDALVVGGMLLTLSARLFVLLTACAGVCRASPSLPFTCEVHSRGSFYAAWLQRGTMIILRRILPAILDLALSDVRDVS